MMNYTSNKSETYFYLSDVRAERTVDVRAETYAVSTQRKPITEQCQPGTMWPYVLDDYKIICSPGFNTSFAFTGKVQKKIPVINIMPDKYCNLPQIPPLVGIGFSPDTKLSIRIGAYNQAWRDANDAAGSGPSPRYLPEGPGTAYEYVLPQNPIHFATWVAGYPTVEKNGRQPPCSTAPLLHDPQIFRTDSGPTYWVLQCSSSIYHVSYTWSNGSVHTFHPTLASPEIGRLMSGPFSFALAPAQIAMA